MQYSAIDDRIVVRPADQFGDLFRVDQAIEAVQCQRLRLQSPGRSQGGCAAFRCR